jgi:Virulence-associated protein E
MFEMPVYPLSLFEPLEAVASGNVAKKRGATDARIPVATGQVNIAALPVDDALRAIIVTGRDPTNPDRFPSRSEAVFFVTCELLRSGVPDPDIKSILIDPDLGISAHMREKGRIADAYADRQIQRGKDAVQTEFHLDRDEKIVRNSQHNIRVALARLGVTVWFDAFRARTMVEGLSGHGPSLDDAGIDAFWLKIDAEFGFRPTPDFFFRVLRHEARTASRHPVQEYFDGLRWDGVQRLDLFLTRYGGAPDTPCVRALSRLMLLGAVRRIRQPGSKLDEMLVIEGRPQAHE